MFLFLILVPSSVVLKCETLLEAVPASMERLTVRLRSV
jgi:hypothetical protein